MKLNLFYTWIFFLTASFAMVAQNIEVTGTVKDEKGEPLLGVLVLIKGTQRGAATNMDGKYEIQTKVGDVLQYSFLGMKTVEKKITASSKREDIVLQALVVLAAIARLSFTDTITSKQFKEVKILTNPCI